MIYLDNAATTAVCPAAVAAAADACEKLYANPSSLHGAGFEAERLLAASRDAVAAALGAEAEELIFTPSGTFADNLALLGTMRRPRAGSLVTSSLEHPAVANAAAQLAREGVEVRYVKPDGAGRVSASDVLAAVDETTSLVSVMLVNNELGTLQPVAEIAAGLKKLRSRALLHTDAVQACGKLKINVRTLGTDMLSLSGHKLHAPKGIGALYIRKGVRLLPLTYGGGQERGLVPGTEPVPGAAALAAAFREASPGDDSLRLAALSALGKLDFVKIISPGDPCCGIISISLPGWRGETVANFLSDRGICVSTGSACGKGKPSAVLSQLGLPRPVLEGALRVSFSRGNTPADIAALCEALTAATALVHVK